MTRTKDSLFSKFHQTLRKKNKGASSNFDYCRRHVFLSARLSLRSAGNGVALDARSESGCLLNRLKHSRPKIVKLQTLKKVLLLSMILLSGCASETPRYSESYRGSLESVVDLDAHLSSLQKLLQNVQNAQSAIDESLKDVQSNSGKEKGK